MRWNSAGGMEPDEGQNGSHPQGFVRSGGKWEAGWRVTANVKIPSVVERSDHRILIEDVYPAVDGGRYPVKRVAGEPVEVWADIFRDGHAVLAADLLWRARTHSAGRAHRWNFTATTAGAASFNPPSPAVTFSRSRPGPTGSPPGGATSLPSGRRG